MQKIQKHVKKKKTTSIIHSSTLCPPHPKMHHPLMLTLNKKGAQVKGGVQSYLEIIAAKNHSNYVLAYVVYVTFNSSQHDGALVWVLERKANSSPLLVTWFSGARQVLGTESNSMQPR